MEINLDDMSLRDLRDLRNKIDRAITTHDDRRRKEAIAAAESAAREFGFNLADLASVKPPRAKIAPKYVNPNDPDATWTGRGRKPRWVHDALESGKTLGDLEI